MPPQHLVPYTQRVMRIVEAAALTGINARMLASKGKDKLTEKTGSTQTREVRIMRNR